VKGVTDQVICRLNVTWCAFGRDVAESLKKLLFLLVIIAILLQICPDYCSQLTGNSSMCQWQETLRNPLEKYFTNVSFVVGFQHHLRKRAN
jgi:hypothetical protein